MILSVFIILGYSYNWEINDCSELKGTCEYYKCQADRMIGNSADLYKIENTYYNCLIVEINKK